MTEYEKFLEAQKLEKLMNQPAFQKIEVTPERMEELRKKYKIEEPTPESKERDFLAAYGSFEDYEKSHKPSPSAKIVQNRIKPTQTQPIGFWGPDGRYWTTPAPTPDTETKKPAETETKKEFTAPKIKDKFNPELVFKEFKEFLKCDIDTFNDWFDGKVSDKKMSWRYLNKEKEPNKEQLRCFLFELCGGWSPKETNIAFKISVDSNNRTNKLNATLLKKIEKCKF